MSRITTGRTDPELESLTSAYAMHPSIEAVVFSGSIGGALADELSDFDVYVYSKSPVGGDFFRKSIGFCPFLRSFLFRSVTTFAFKYFTNFELMKLKSLF
jgi:hypothetical protein